MSQVMFYRFVFLPNEFSHGDNKAYCVALYCVMFLLCLLNNNNNNDDNNNSEILNKREPLVCTRVRRAGHIHTHTHTHTHTHKRLEQYNSNNKLIHGQYTSRYNIHHTRTHTYTPRQAKVLKIERKTDLKNGKKKPINE